MKALFALFTAFLIVFFFGCQESTITDPGAVNDNGFSQQQIQDPAYKDLLSYYPMEMEVPKTVFDPTHPQNAGSKIAGFIRYDIQSLPVSATQQRPRYTVEIRFYVNLILKSDCPLQHKLMKVIGFASQQLNFAHTDKNAPQIVTKEFNVCNCYCGRMKMVLKFGVYEKEAYLYSMELVKIKGMPVGEPEL